LKRRLIETWLGIQQNIIDHAIDQWRVGLNECVKAKGKHFYRAMHFSAKRGIAIACRLSVCPSVRL